MAQFTDRNRCNFRCTRQASFTLMIDNQSTTATCSSGNVNERCMGCCESWGLTNRASKAFQAQMAELVSVVNDNADKIAAK
uniref:Uncharacterized protein n=1 Tax=Panagrolaimus sp. ES5 TaxID=591445 RepID=A0AC34GPG5_9BILA